MSFIFGGDTGLTYDELQRKRKIADALMYGRARDGAPKNVGEGLNAVGQALLYKSMNKKLDAQDQKLRDDFGMKWDIAMGLTGKPGGSNSSPSFAGEYDYTPTKYNIDEADPRRSQFPTEGGQYASALPSKQDVMSYITEAATARGIDPNVALRVAASEGLNADPREAWQSNFVKNGKRERSYGPYQLYIDGGLGNQFMETGMDPRDPSTWKHQVDFALDHAKKNGWGAWYGAANSGIGNMEGIGGGNMDMAKAMQIASLAQSPYATPEQKMQAQFMLQRAQDDDAMRRKQSDPMYRMGLEKAALELDALRNPQNKPRDTQYVDGVGLIDKQTGDVITTYDPAQSVDVEGESKLRKEFTGLQPVKDFTTQAEAYGRIVAAARDPSPAGDLSLIFNFMKVLDPGSVVRESEFATAESAAAWMQNSEEAGMMIPRPIANAIRKMNTGQRLSPEQRQDFVSQAASLYGQAERQHESLAGHYGVTAEAYGFDRDRTIPDFRFKEQGAPMTSQRPPSQRPPSASPGLPAAQGGVGTNIQGNMFSGMSEDQIRQRIETGAPLTDEEMRQLEEYLGAMQ